MEWAGTFPLSGPSRHLFQVLCGMADGEGMIRNTTLALIAHYMRCERKKVSRYLKVLADEGQVIPLGQDEQKRLVFQIAEWRNSGLPHVREEGQRPIAPSPIYIPTSNTKTKEVKEKILTERITTPVYKEDYSISMNELETTYKEGRWGNQPLQACWPIETFSPGLKPTHLRQEDETLTDWLARMKDNG